jgi:hypothetical protein
MKEYFKYIKEVNDGGGGWAGQYYGILSEIINQNNLKIGCEVGIGYGLHAENILKNTNIEKLYLVDPMEYYENDAFPIDIVNNGGFELLKDEILLNLKKYEKRYEFFRTTSTGISNSQIPDNSLDFVFIDGNHSYEYVKNDLEFWYKKVKNSGYITGDDYENYNFGVKQAVDEFVEKNNFILTFVTKEGKEKSGIFLIKKT